MDINNKISILPGPQTATGISSLKPTEKTGTDIAADKVLVASSSAERQEQGEQQLDAAVAKINDYVQNEQRNIRFSVDEQSGRDVVTVLDSETDEVIRQIPIEEVLVFVRNLNELSTSDITLFSSQA